MNNIYTKEYVLHRIQVHFRSIFSGTNNFEGHLSINELSSNESGAMYTVRYRGFHTTVSVNDWWNNVFQGDHAGVITEYPSYWELHGKTREKRWGDNIIEMHSKYLISQIMKAGIKYADGQRLKPKPKFVNYTFHTGNSQSFTIKLDTNQDLSNKAMDAIVKENQRKIG